MLDVTEAREFAPVVRRAWRWVRTKARPDHQTILTRRMPDSGHYVGGFYSVVAVAPSRRLRHPVDPSELVEAATQWVAVGWPEALDGTVNMSTSDLVRFETTGPGGEIDLSVEIRPNGLVETRTRLPTDERADGPYLDLVDVLRPIAVLARAIDQPPLQHLWHRWYRRQLDWYVNLSSQDARRDGATHWAGLNLPGASPPHRATNAFPTTPQGGFASDQITGWRRRRPVVELMSLAAKSLLEHTGYHSFGNAPAIAAHRAVATSNAPPEPGERMDDPPRVAHRR